MRGRAQEVRTDEREEKMRRKKIKAGGETRR